MTATYDNLIKKGKSVIIKRKAKITAKQNVMASNFSWIAFMPRNKCIEEDLSEYLSMKIIEFTSKIAIKPDIPTIVEGDSWFMIPTVS